VTRRRRSIITANALFLLFIFLFFLPTFVSTRFFSLKTSAIDLKLQHMVENGPSSRRDIFRKSDTESKLEPFELKMELATPICQRNGDFSLQLQQRNAHYNNSGGDRPDSSSSSSRTEPLTVIVRVSIGLALWLVSVLPLNKYRCE